MKTHRMSRSTEARNATRAIAFRGGSNAGPKTISQDHAIVSGRRLRRAARSRKARLDVLVATTGGHQPGPYLPITGEIRALLGCLVS